MANEEKLGSFDILVKRVEGETVDGQPAYAMAVFDAGVTPSSSSISGIGLDTGTTNYALQGDEISTPAGYSGLLLFWDVFTLPASGSISLFVDAKNPLQVNDYYAYYQSSYLPATGSTATMRLILLYAGATDDSSLLWDLERKPVPGQWRIRTAVTGGSGSWGYGVGYQFID